ncbi:soluble NSF attachment protein receptor [Ochromonadaceae sp. CCMP2298]|nr:soluble NSF attachment protein receptor [Ochromonadaceae sp. CCMP2298]|mmetsp:Transcript_15402/g.33967  ORF Transcript_15402/g.33967 Transcript_15402/m.33967 type:complete len:200 (-) Transcript_15402:114-713(-)|eukprot:CAMPEP_0173190304 /NCGR_PEP_ID=MMETSP1141-20130122/12273_1 /TAXON_ID=483371 /ORGANISM="non described non described, Strain CCMP2298" /LENGTH=199 /DNA_ID=CAMNT_0014114403 /DNA_START=183 /DNA_END=782 /DNA_ORIENTATION=+
MKILGIGILRFNADTSEPVMITQTCELSSFGFFQRGTVREMLTFFNKTIAKRTPPGQRQSVQNEEYFVHVYMRADGLCGSVTCDSEYPPRVAFSLLTRLLEDFIVFKPDWSKETRNEAITWPQLETDIVKYQDPANADQIMKIQRNLDETRDVLHNTIDSVLQRGEKLEDLVERSGELSSQSKLFYREAKRANSCCAVA